MRFETVADYLHDLEDDHTLAVLPLQAAADFLNRTRAAIDRMLKEGRLGEIRIGRTRFVRVYDLIERQQKFDERVAQVRRFLEQCARERKTVTYEPVMSLVGLTHLIPADRKEIGAILGKLSEATYADDRILLSVIVHRKTQGKTRPGPGFKTLAEYLGFKWKDFNKFVSKEMEKVWSKFDPEE